MSTELGQKGPLLRLSGLSTAELPSLTATADELRPFLATLLDEAIPFLDSVPTTSTSTSTSTNTDTSSSSSSPPLWKSKGTKRFPEASDAPIEVTERVLRLPVASGTGTGTETGTETETWACRRSVHVDAARRGTASWGEFVECLRDRHAETEEAFTPTVLGHAVVGTWAGAKEVGVITGSSSSSSSSSSSWGRFEMAVVEMKHKIPPPLQPRVFGVLQVACTAMTTTTTTTTTTSTSTGREQATEGEAFVVISVPIKDLATGALQDKATLSRDKGVVLGAYAAVERVRRLRDGHDGGPSTGEGEAKVEWVMATASDAKGVLPMWVQVRAVPGQVAKDVKLFLGWVEGERARGGLKGVVQ